MTQFGAMVDNGDWYPVPKYFPHSVGFPEEQLPEVIEWLAAQKFKLMTDYLDAVMPFKGMKYICFRDAEKAMLLKLTYGVVSSSKVWVDE